MKEVDVQRQLKKYMDTHPSHPFLQEPFSLEIKLVKNNRFAFNAVRPHQITALAGEPVLWKITDVFAPTGNPTGKKPFDFFWGCGLKGYLGIAFYIPRKHKVVYFVDVLDYLKLRDQKELEGRKSAKEVDIKKISKFTVNLLSYKGNKKGYVSF